MEKGQYGYLKRRKDHNLRMTMICLAIVLALIGLGLIIWKSRYNLLMVPAMMCVIPLANYLVAYLALARFHAPDPALYGEMSAYEEAGMLLSDLVIVDEKGKRSGLPMAVLYKNGIVGYQPDAKDSKDAVEITVNDTLKRRGIPMRIKVYRDWKDFRDRLAEVEPVIEEEYARRIELARNAVLSVSM